GAPSVISEVSIAFSSVVGFGEKVCTGSGVENRCGFLGAYEQSDIISDINAVCVEDPVNSVVYKRSYPFSGSNLIPDLADTQKMGRQTKIILIRRHFFDNVNSILRRDFEKNMDDALSRIILGYRNLYKQINTLISSGHQLLILDYCQVLIDHRFSF
ncbi:hypothetical protein, partial [Thiolapillus sp.]|uniref:hypothetical protein n=1 Tax=Thiolapillus sp. TaxID=2017437 RepID=UPI003AF98087